MRERPMRVVTSFSKAGYEEYGKRFLQTFFVHWPSQVELVIYSEDMGRANNRSNVIWRDLNAIKDLQAFREKNAHLAKIQDYRFNALKFANKAFAIIDGTDFNGRAIWLDADVVTIEDIDMEWLKALLPGDAYLSFLGRYPMHTETGFLMFDCAHSAHGAFMEAFRRMYTTGALFKLKEWHDCMAFDEVRIRLKLLGKQHNLNPDPAEMHPFVKSVLGERMDHLKGGRKTLEASPEHRGHKPKVRIKQEDLAPWLQ